MKAYDPTQVTMNGVQVMSPNEWSEESPLTLLKKIVTVGGVSLEQIRQCIAWWTNYTAMCDPGHTISQEVNDMARTYGVWVFWTYDQLGFKKAKAAVCGKLWRVDSYGWVLTEAAKLEVKINCEIQVPHLWPYGEVRK